MKITREQMKKIKDAMCLAEWFVEGDTCEAKDKATDKAAYLASVRRRIARRCHRKSVRVCAGQARGYKTRSRRKVLDNRVFSRHYQGLYQL